MTKEEWFNVWINNNCFTYVLLDEHANEAQLEKKFPQFMEKYMGKDMAKMGSKFELSLTPLNDIYFETASVYDNVKHGDKKVVYIFLSIAVLILADSMYKLYESVHDTCGRAFQGSGVAKSDGRFAKSPCMAIYWRINIAGLYFMHSFHRIITIIPAVLQ